MYFKKVATALVWLTTSCVCIEAFITKPTFKLHSHRLESSDNLGSTTTPFAASTKSTVFKKRNEFQCNLSSQNNEESMKKIFSIFTAAAISCNSLFFGMVSNPSPAMAESSRQIAAISGSGLVFKDTLIVESFDDPKVQGVTLYISNFQRPLAERLQKDFFSDPSFASVGCAKTAPTVKVADNIAVGPQGEVRATNNVSIQIFFNMKSLPSYSHFLWNILCIHRKYLKNQNHYYSKHYVFNEFMIRIKILSFMFRLTQGWIKIVTLISHDSKVPFVL